MKVQFVGGQICPATAAKAVTGAVAALKDKNPYSTSNDAVKSSSSYVGWADQFIFEWNKCYC